MKYFSIPELTTSQTAKEKGIDNTPNEQQTDNLIQLVGHVLDPLREAYGKPIIVSSGFRSIELNTAIGGVKTSQHCKGEAVDIIPKEKSDLKSLFRLILSLNLPFDQLIYEKAAWIHVSMRGNKQYQRGEILTYDGNGYKRLTREQAVELFREK